MLGVKPARATLVGLAFVFLLAFAPHAFALSTGQAASLVLGQSSFTTSNTVATPTEEDLPVAITFDSSGNLWVADQNNNRVLEYKAPFLTHEAASIGMGQSDLTSSGTATTPTGLNSPSGLAFDPSGNLWVVDSLNSRVVEYKAPFSTGEAASVVIGQSGLTSSDFTDLNSTGLSYPTGLAFDSTGNLWVVDFRQSRVLEYTAPLSTHKAASLVIGQTSFTTRECAFTSTCNANSTNLFDPNAVAFDSAGNLWVSDGDNNRVLEYGAPFSTHEAASVAIGQSSFTGHAAATTQTGLSAPEGLTFDSGHGLWVADYSNSRVLQFGGSVTPTATTTSTASSVTTSSKATTSSSTTSTTTSSITATSTTTATTPEFPALAVPVILTIALAVSLFLLKPASRFRQV